MRHSAKWNSPQSLACPTPAPDSPAPPHLASKQHPAAAAAPERWGETPSSRPRHWSSSNPYKRRPVVPEAQPQKIDLAYPAPIPPHRAAPAPAAATSRAQNPQRSMRQSAPRSRSSRRGPRPGATARETANYSRPASALSFNHLTYLTYLPLPPHP